MHPWVCHEATTASVNLELGLDVIDQWESHASSSVGLETELHAAVDGLALAVQLADANRYELNTCPP